MNHKLLLTIIGTLLFNQTTIQAQDIDKELITLSEKLATLVKENGKKKVTVLDFTDLQGGSSELGKYIAEELTVNLVIAKQGFSVLDRANLRRILAEHKLTASGLIDPENAKKLGMFAGVDALILGTIIPKGSNVNLNAKIITTDTAEIIGAARAAFQGDENVEQLASVATTTGGGFDDTPVVVKPLGDLRLELQALQVVDGDHYLLRMTVTNHSKKTAYVALSTDMSTSIKGIITDSEGSDHTPAHPISGIEMSFRQYGGFFRATEIKAGSAIAATMRFKSLKGKIRDCGEM